jgi:hypothetical protein
MHWFFRREGRYIAAAVLEGVYELDVMQNKFHSNNHQARWFRA